MILRQLNNSGKAFLKLNKSSICFNHSLLDRPAYTSKVFCLTEALEQAAAEPASLASIEEKLLNLMTPGDDDVLLNFLPKHIYRPYDYESLCMLFKKLAAINRRNPLLMRAASISLCKLPLNEETIVQPIPQVIISAIDAISRLNYPNPILLSKLLWDLNETIDFNNLSPKTICTLLRSLAHLRWRNDDIIDKLIGYTQINAKDDNFNHEIVTTLFHVCAHLNHNQRTKLQDVRDNFLAGSREETIKLNPRHYLDYVWCLTALRIVEESHLRDVMKIEFFDQLKSKSEGNLKFNDILKLLNLSALAKLEFKLDLDYNHLDQLTHVELKKSGSLIKLSDIIKLTLNSIVTTAQDYNYNVDTPFGFVVDFEFLLDDDANPHPLDTQNSLAKSIETGSVPEQHLGSLHNCALIVTSFDDTIVNSSYEVVGHKRMISMILKTLGYKTVYLTEGKINEQKSSADLVNFVKNRLKKAVVRQTLAKTK